MHRLSTTEAVSAAVDPADKGVSAIPLRDHPAQLAAEPGNPHIKSPRTASNRRIVPEGDPRQEPSIHGFPGSERQGSQERRLRRLQGDLPPGTGQETSVQHQRLTAELDGEFRKRRPHPGEQLFRRPRIAEVIVTAEGKGVWEILRRTGYYDRRRGSESGVPLRRLEQRNRAYEKEVVADTVGKRREGLTEEELVAALHGGEGVDALSR